MNDDAEELSDYRILLACIRKRLRTYGLTEALESLERLDHAILEAIVEQEMAFRTIN
jgi:hypothetical protein